jgi:hypothetical protein
MMHQRHHASDARAFMHVVLALSRIRCLYFQAIGARAITHVVLAPSRTSCSHHHALRARTITHFVLYGSNHIHRGAAVLAEKYIRSVSGCLEIGTVQASHFLPVFTRWCSKFEQSRRAP